jgi:hypothetical protein
MCALTRVSLSTNKRPMAIDKAAYAAHAMSNVDVIDVALMVV